MKYQIVLLLSFLCINIIHPQNKKQLDFINNEITKSISYLNLKYDNCYEIISQRKIIHFDLWDNKKEDYLVIYKIRYNSEKGEYYQYLAKFFDSIRDKLSFTNSVSLYSNKIENAKIKLLSTNSYLFTIGITNNGNTDSIVFNYGSQQSTLSAKWNNQIELPELNDAWWFWEEGFKSFRIGEKVEVGYFQSQSLSCSHATPSLSPSNLIGLYEEENPHLLKNFCASLCVLKWAQSLSGATQEYFR